MVTLLRPTHKIFRDIGAMVQSRQITRQIWGTKMGKILGTIMGKLIGKILAKDHKILGDKIVEIGGLKIRKIGEMQHKMGTKVLVRLTGEIMEIAAIGGILVIETI